MSEWAATNTLREALAVAWPEGDHAEPNVFTEALDALALVEAALDLGDELRLWEPGRKGYAAAQERAKVEALRDRERV